MSIKLTILAILIGLQAIPVKAQDDETYTDEDTASVITNENYSKHPRWYLRYIDSSKIHTGILIDRVKFRNDIGLFNGKSRVKTSDYTIFRKMRKTFEKASLRNLNFSDFDSIYQFAYNKMRWQQIYPIAISNYKYEKIRKKAIEENIISLTDTGLVINTNADSIFLIRRSFITCPFNNRAHGDKIKFAFYKNMYFTNDPNESIVKIEANFGDGWKTFTWAEPQLIDFGNKTDFINVKVRLTIKNKNELAQRKLISHFSILRTGSDLVPEPSDLSVDNRKSASVNPNKTIYYPKSKITYTSVCDNWESPCGVTPLKKKSALIEVCNEPAVCTKYSYYPNYSSCDIEASILFAPTNTSGKFRKPIIICDGFDPGDLRDYNQTFVKNPTGDPKMDDYRGIFELMSGEKSAWSKDPGATLVQNLLTSGYDIVIINWLKGAGDIPTNGEALRGFLNDTINSSKYRDNQTEEIILVGPSMGGLITRYCLKTMENAGEEHHVKLWLSFDSPQEGAYIPISLQWTINYLDDLSSNASTQNAIWKLNTDAAKQMLLYQYKAFNGTGTQPANHLPEFTNFYSTMHALEYPRYSKNIAITNGGKGKLYPNSNVLICNIEVEQNLSSTYWWYRTGQWLICRLEPICQSLMGAMGVFISAEGYSNTNNEVASQIFEGTASVTFSQANVINISDLPNSFSTNNQIGFDNAPGGYHTALYDFNQNDENQIHVSTNETTNPQNSKATFMPTVSAFGIAPSRENIYKTWDDLWQNYRSQIPFDDIQGMQDYGNEEHCRVSNITSTWLQKYLLTQRNDIQKPYARTSGYTETESKACLYTAANNVTFGGVTGSKFVFNPTADVKITAGSKITFKPGVKLLKGAKLTAKPGAVSNGSQKAAVVSKWPAVTYLSTDPYLNKVYDYSEQDAPTEVKQLDQPRSSIAIYPNPANDYVNIKGTGAGKAYVQVMNIYGQSVLTNYGDVNGIRSINIASLPNGLYFIDIATPNGHVREKLIKK